MKTLVKNLKNGALSRYLIKSIKKYFIKNFIKNPENGALSRSLIKNLRATNKAQFKRLLKNLKQLRKNLKNI